MLKLIITIIYILIFVVNNIFNEIKKESMMLIDYIHIHNIFKIRRYLSDFYAENISKLIINMIRILVYDTTVIVPIFLCILTGWLRSDEIINDDKIFSILTISFAIIAIHIAIIMGLYSNFSVTKTFNNLTKDRLCRATLYMSILLMIIASYYIILLPFKYCVDIFSVLIIIGIIFTIIFNDAFVMIEIIRKLTKE